MKCIKCLPLKTATSSPPSAALLLHLWWQNLNWATPCEIKKLQLLHVNSGWTWNSIAAHDSVMTWRCRFSSLSSGSLILFHLLQKAAVRTLVCRGTAGGQHCQLTAAWRRKSRAPCTHPSLNSQRRMQRPEEGSRGSRARCPSLFLPSRINRGQSMGVRVHQGDYTRTHAQTRARTQPRADSTGIIRNIWDHLQREHELWWEPDALLGFTENTGTPIYEGPLLAPHALRVSVWVCVCVCASARMCVCCMCMCVSMFIDWFSPDL